MRESGLFPFRLTQKAIRLLILAGFGFIVCTCSLASLFVYRPDPPADALLFTYAQGEAFGIFTSRPDGSNRRSVYYSNPPPFGLASAWEGAPQTIQDPLRAVIEQDIPHHPAWTAAGSRITFKVSNHGRACDEVITMVANGRNPQTVACISRAGREEASAWSPDGTRLAVIRDQGAQTTLAILDSNGIPLQDIALSASVWGISWSPDSARIALTVDSPDSLQIIHPDLSVASYQPDASAFGQPAWSPDGKRLAFFCVSNERIDICSLNADGTDKQRIYFPPSFPYLKYHLTWSPAADTLAFEANQPGGYNDIFLIEADGSDLRQLTFDPAADTEPAWAPDGSQIVFASLRDGNWELYRITSAGTGLTRVTNTPGEERQPSWRPAPP